MFKIKRKHFIILHTNIILYIIHSRNISEPQNVTIYGIYCLTEINNKIKLNMSFEIKYFTQNKFDMKMYYFFIVHNYNYMFQKLTTIM